MSVLLLAEVTDGELNRDATARAVSAVQALGDVTLLCVGAKAKEAANAAATIQGVARVLCAEDALYSHRLAEPVAALVAQLAEGHEVVAAPATTDAKNIMPRVAALLDVMIIPDVLAVHGDGSFDRPVYAGNAVQTVRSKDATKVITIRTTGFEPAAEGGSASVEDVAPAADPGLSSWVEDKLAESDRPEL
ncbi:MAG: electron transfer flavoprotein subunit alpha/FixB family protein, partial [Limimaricola soesokkakensis]